MSLCSAELPWGARRADRAWPLEPDSPRSRPRPAIAPPCDPEDQLSLSASGHITCVVRTVSGPAPSWFGGEGSQHQTRKALWSVSGAWEL